MTTKIRKTQIFRHLVQLLLFILLPGLYILAFSELKSIYEMIIKGNFNFVQVFPSLIEFLSVIFVTIILGRFFCGWMCAFGAYNDLVHEISSKVFKVKFKINEEFDSYLKYLKYVILIFIIIVVWTMGSNIFQGASPWDAFAQITDISNVISNYTIGLIFLALITIGAFFIERFFCRYLCPLGALFSIFSKINIFKINKPREKCGKCRLCTNNCSMGIPLYKVKEVRGGECINCLKCTEVCPRQNAQANVMGENVNANLASSIALATMVGVYGVNNLAGTVMTNAGISNAVSISTSSLKTPSVKYKDGTYTGTGTGFRGGTTKVSVTISGGKITKVTTVSNEDTPDFYSKAEKVVPNEILSAQSTSVDTVSGATYSSNGIISAVADALSNAEETSNTSSTSTTSESNTTSAAENTKNTSSESTSKNQSNTESSNTTENNNSSSNSNTKTSASSSASSSVAQSTKYKDGTYTGEGTGFRGGTTKVSVTISKGKITSINTISNGDTPEFYERAESVVPDEIISAQSTSVDTVSRATFSSRGIIDAVADALNKAI